MTPYLRFITLLCFTSLLGACSLNKLEARLEADPQCKSVMNVKTGVLMPCPGTDKEFYKSMPHLQANVGNNSGAENSIPLTAKAVSAPVECKPQLHQKSGSLVPCPAP